ncbi:hypothetical protein, partial [Burkholderia ubonensis]|uniref:hypothetical protein n=1 Tax=Burkholderia ubonensis TaxID=101571 RepID=UPI002AAFD9CC
MFIPHPLVEYAFRFAKHRPACSRRHPDRIKNHAGSFRAGARLDVNGGAVPFPPLEMQKPPPV